ncbi:dTMP kinase [Eggerthellaceae bacterium 3-80]|nr:dTMP kinase [bacterium D16-34]
MTQSRSAVASGDGIFITFEGGDGAGKSTHIRFLAEALMDAGYEVVCLREPGGTAIGEAMRAILLDPAQDQISPRAELLVYEACRAQLIDEVIAPALKRGAVVLCDRFTDSTHAYQGAGRGLDDVFIEQANVFACQGVAPHRTILMTTGSDAAANLARATHKGNADRLELEGEAFHNRVNAAYEKLALRFPDRVVSVVSDKEKAVTARRVFGAVADLFDELAALLDDDEYFSRFNTRHVSAEAPLASSQTTQIGDKD